MEVEIGQRWSKRSREYTVIRIDVREIFTYIWVLPDGEEDIINNHLCFGKKLFKQEFKFMKGEHDGRC